MKLFEHETKTILQSYQIPIPSGRVASTADEAIAIAANANPPFVVKAQVLVAGRGKAGGILFAETPQEVGIVSGKLLGTLIKGYPVKKVLVEERISIVRELYFGITVDRLHREYAAIASTAGGIDIEEAAAENPQSTVKILISHQEGFTLSDATRIARQLGYREQQQIELCQIMVSLYRAGVDYDAELIELNPVVETENGSFVAVDARLVVDDNSLFRHPELEKLRYSESRDITLDELEAQRAGLTYVNLGGNVGVIGNGAGLVMATIDTIQYYGGKAADFLDLGGGASIEAIEKALDLVIRNMNVKVTLVNILGGITHCDDVARAIANAQGSYDSGKRLVARIAGTNEKEGKEILQEARIPVFESMEEAARYVVDLAKLV